MSRERWERVERLFHDVLSQPTEQREGVLADAEIAIAAEVRSLLDAHRAATETESPLVGKRLGDYRIVREVGRGGMGAIYEAVRDDDAFRKRVAIKVIKRGMDTDAIVRRFRNERQILADLDHPGIARLLDGGATDDGRPFLVMEFIDGTTLDRAAEALNIDQKLALFERVCDAVAYAHARGVIHRDLKPANILITSDGTPKLLDFGIAKVFDTESGHGTGTLTAAGCQALTPAYASLEQLRGERVTPASDVYSLGVILYELLTGRHPREVHGQSLEQMSASATMAEVIPPSAAVTAAGPRTTGEIQRWQRRLRGDVDNIIVKALEQQPALRYATAGAFGDDIRRHLAGQPVLARRTTAWRRVVRRGRPLALPLVLLLALAAIATSVVLVLRPRTTFERRPPRPTRVVEPLMSRLTNFGDVTRAAISTDGNLMVYARGVERSLIFVRDLATGADRQLPVPETMFTGKLRLTPSADRLIFAGAETAAHRTFDLWEVATSGSRPMRRLARGIQEWVAISGDGKKVAFWRLDRRGSSPAWLLTLHDLRSGAEEVVFRQEPSASCESISWSADGKSLLFAKVERAPVWRSTIWELDLASRHARQKSSASWQLIHDIEATPDDAGAVIVTERRGQYLQLWYVPWGDEQPQRLTSDVSTYSHATVAPATNAVLAIRSGSPGNVYVVDVTTGNPAQLTFGDNYCRSLAYLPDGNIVYGLIGQGQPALHVIQPDGRNDRRLPIPIAARVPRVDPTHRRLAFTSDVTGTDEIYLANLDGTDVRQLTHAGPITVGRWDWWPDGQSIVYATLNRSGIDRISIAGGPVQKIADSVVEAVSVSPDGRSLLCRVQTSTTPPEWHLALIGVREKSIRIVDPPRELAPFGFVKFAPDGRSFTFTSNNTEIWRQPLDGSKPVKLTRFGGGNGVIRGQYDFSPDGRAIAVPWGVRTGDVVMIRNFQ